MVDYSPTIRLVQRVQAGDARAFDLLHAQYKPLLIASARVYSVPAMELTDVMQEMRMGLLIAARAFDASQGNFGSFLKMALRSRMASVLKTARRIKHLHLENAACLDGPARDGSSITLYDVLPGGCPDPLAVLMAREDVQGCLAALSPLEVGAVCCIADGLSYVEAGRELGCSAKSVDNARCRILRKMQTARRCDDETEEGE